MPNIPSIPNTPPKPNSLNTINSFSPSVRDALLSMNLTSTYPNINTNINGSPRVGEPVIDLESNFLNTYPHQKLSQDTSSIDILGSVLNGQGIGISNTGLVPNYDVRGSLVGRVLGATGLLSDSRIGTIGAQQLALALTNNAAFNVQEDLLGALNVTDNMLSLLKEGELSGLRPNYKITIPSSTTGRLFNAASSILGFTLPKSYLEPFGSIFQSENFGIGNIERANEMIKNTGKGQVLQLISNIRENLNVDSPFRSGYAPGFNNNKGQRQITESESNVYAFDTNGTQINLLKIPDNGVIPTLSGPRKISDFGFKSPEETNDSTDCIPSYRDRTVNSVGFSWTSKEGDAVNSGNNFFIAENEKKDIKSILVKTQKLFDDVNMKTLVSVKGDMNIESSQINTTNGGGISKGSAVLSGGRYDINGNYKGDINSADETYCRSWTTFNRYDNMSKLIRHGTNNKNGLYGSKDIAFRDTIGKSVNSILENNGMPKIAPYTTDIESDPKKFMFSIENLAWCDNIESLPDSEKGPGDLVNNKRGRIMWFPPYNINFSESNAVNIESTNFIGRGEPVYTYNNTERSGNLTFQVIVDHSSYTNAFRGNDGPVDNYVASFMAGCAEPLEYFKNRLTVFEREVLESQINAPTNTAVVENKVTPSSWNIYFPNDNVQLLETNQTYENGLQNPGTDKIDYTTNAEGRDFGIKVTPANYTKGITDIWSDNTNYGLNSNGTEAKVLKKEELGVDVYGSVEDLFDNSSNVSKFLSENPYVVVEIKGFASPQGILENNKKLATDRGKFVYDLLKINWFPSATEEERTKRIILKPGEIDTTATNCDKGNDAQIELIGCKKARRTEVSFKYSDELAGAALVVEKNRIANSNKKVRAKITDKFYNESNYFDKLEKDDPFIFDEFRKKIKYFQPAFHSTTPEGLNSRLTFLLQCTRQGPTTENKNANNLAFGRPPVCILRIGDFYNTKIMMDSVSFDYEPLVWDLNPEGVGVQPMIANVTISFKIIGGSTLYGPINKLQNALSFNYFANTQVYDTRADYISKNAAATETVGGVAGEGFGGYHINNGEPIPEKKITEIIKEDGINKSTDEVANQNSETNVPVNSDETPGTLKITSISCDQDNIVKSLNEWTMTIKMKTNDKTIEGEDAVNQLEGGYEGYKLRIKDINSNEMYESPVLTKDQLIGMLKPSYSTESDFNVPINKGSGIGLKDSLGRENFYIAVVKDDVELSKVQIKLK